MRSILFANIFMITRYYGRKISDESSTREVLARKPGKHSAEISMQVSHYSKNDNFAHDIILERDF